MEADPHIYLFSASATLKAYRVLQKPLFATGIKPVPTDEDRSVTRNLANGYFFCTSTHSAGTVEVNSFIYPTERCLFYAIAA